MYIYLVAFSVSSMMFYLSTTSKRKSQKNFLAAIGILMLAVLAGLRDASVGTDVNVYGRALYTGALNSSSFVSYYSSHVTSLLSEPGYYLLTYFLSLFFKDYHWGLFVYQLLPLIFVYLGMKRCEKLFNTPVWLGMLLYDLMLYNYSLNIIRQCIAVGFVFYGVTFLFEKRYKPYTILILLAVAFHTMGIIGLAILPMYLILQQGKSISQMKQIERGVIFIILLFAILISGSQIVAFLVSRGVLREFYLEYLSGGRYSGSTTGVPRIIVFGHIIYTLVLVSYKRFTDRRGGESLFLIMSSIIVGIASFAVGYIQYIDRLSFFFVPLQAVGLANIYNCNRPKKIYAFLIVGFALVLWYYSFVMKGSGETIPYKFFFA